MLELKEDLEEDIEIDRDIDGFEDTFTWFFVKVEFGDNFDWFLSNVEFLVLGSNSEYELDLHSKLDGME